MNERKEESKDVFLTFFFLHLLFPNAKIICTDDGTDARERKN